MKRVSAHLLPSFFPSVPFGLFKEPLSLISDRMFGSNKEKSSGTSNGRQLSDDFHPSKAQLKRATRARKIWALLTSLLLLISVVFLILVELGNTSINPTLNKIYFIKLDLADIIPVNVPNAVLINSIAETLGLHDFYTVGLWSFCEGYNGQGVTFCSNPKTLYWFNPIQIVQSELLYGATSTYPNLLKCDVELANTM